MSRTHENNFKTTLASSFSDVDTSITLTDNLPTIGAGDWVVITITDNVNYELVKISSNTGAPTYSVDERAMEGTVAQDWISGQQVSIRITKGSVDDKQDVLSGASLSAVTADSNDRILIQDDSDSGNLKTILPSEIIGIASPFQLVASRSASNSPSLDFNDLPSCNAIMFILCNVIPATDDVYLRIRTSDDTGGSPTFDTGGTDYYSSYDGVANANTHSSAMDQWDSIRLHSNALSNKIGNGSDEGLSGTIYIYKPTSGSGAKHIRGMVSYTDPGGGEAVYNFSGKRLNTSAVNALQFSMSSGNITSGTIDAYKIG